MNEIEQTRPKIERMEKLLLQLLTGIVTISFLVNIIYTIMYNGYRENTIKEGTTSFEPNKSNISSPIPTPDPKAIITKGILDHSLVEITKCTGNGSELIVTGTITNQGVDGNLKICANCMSDSAIRLYDDVGNRITCNMLEIGSVKDRLSVNFKFVSGVKVPLIMKFTTPTVGGITQAKKIALLEICAETNKVVRCEFRNLTIESIMNSTSSTHAIRNVK